MCTIASVTRSRTVLDACNAATEIHYDSSPVAGQLLLNQKRVTHSEEDVDDQWKLWLDRLTTALTFAPRHSYEQRRECVACVFFHMGHILVWTILDRYALSVTVHFIRYHHGGRSLTFAINRRSTHARNQPMDELEYWPLLSLCVCGSRAGQPLDRIYDM